MIYSREDLLAGRLLAGRFTRGRVTRGQGTRGQELLADKNYARKIILTRKIILAEDYSRGRLFSREFQSAQEEHHARDGSVESGGVTHVFPRSRIPPIGNPRWRAGKL